MEAGKENSYVEILYRCPVQTWCPGTVLPPEGSTWAPCPSTGTNLKRFSSVPAVFTFLQAVEKPTPNLSPISRYSIRFPSCL